MQAAREALTNAAKFAGAERVDLYAEIGPSRVEVFVRDRGVGFDPAAIPSIGAACATRSSGASSAMADARSITSAPGAGTEVELVVERGRGERGPVAMSPVPSS